MPCLPELEAAPLQAPGTNTHPHAPMGLCTVCIAWQVLAAHSPGPRGQLCLLGDGPDWVPGPLASGVVASPPYILSVLSGVFTDVEASLKDIKDLLGEDELLEQKFQEAVGQVGASTAVSKAELAEVRREWAKYMEVHEKASFTNSELHRAMNLHVSNLRLLSGPLDQVRAALPTPALSPGERARPVPSLRCRAAGGGMWPHCPPLPPEDKAVLQNLKRILAKVQEMRDQRVSLEQQLRELIQKDDITASLVTADHSEMKVGWAAGRDRRLRPDEARP